MAGVACRLRVARIVLAAALVALVTACGRPEPSPETIFEPDGVDLIASADPTNELLRYTLESGAKLEIRRDSSRTLESTGRAEPGDLLAHGAADGEQWLAVFGPLDPPRAAIGPAWIAIAPAWITDEAIVFNSGLRLQRSPDFAVDPTARPPAESGYVVVGTFLLDIEGSVVALVR